MKYICKICGESFESYTNTIYGQQGSISQKFKKHLKDKHNITLEQYIIKFYFNNKIPTCQCGCGAELIFKPKNALWNPLNSFGKYVNCSHVGRNNESQKQKLHQNYLSKWENIEWVKEHYYTQYGKEIIEMSAKDFLENYEYTKYDFQKKYGIDFRTLKNIWFRLNLVTKDEYDKKIKYNQYNLSSKRRKQKFDNKEEICGILYNIIKNFPQKYNIRSLIKYYNDNNLIQIETDIYIILQSLIELYGEEIYDYLQYGLHSKEEIEFSKVLKYLVKGKYKIGLRLQYGNNKRESYIYDICINNKYIIEYDSTGIYHKNIIERDKLKEQFAINKGYKIKHISYKEFRDPNTYLQINNWINND